MLQGYGDAVLRVEALEEQLVKARKHSAALQSKLDGAFAQYHNEVQDMHAKSDELVRKNKSLRNKNKGTCCLVEYPLEVACSSLTRLALLIAKLETRVEQLRASEVDMKNLFYREKEAREVLEYDYKQLAYECDKNMELRIASDRDLVNCYKSLQKLNEDCEKLRAQMKELEEATGASPRGTEDSSVGRPAEGSTQPSGDVREALGEVDPQPDPGIYEVALPEGSS
jgi:DNA repair exonuclease SbcCD ATPase subunit